MRLLPVVALVLGSGASATPSSRAAPPASFPERLMDALPPALRPLVAAAPPLRGPPDRTARLAFLAALAHRADDAGHYSEEEVWRRLGPWPDGSPDIFYSGLYSPERSPGLFPVPAGRDDPAIDFAASVAAANLDPHHFACNFPRRARFLVARGLAHGPLPADSGTCARLRRAFRGLQPVGVDLIFASPRWEDPSASFGHVLLRVRLADDGAPGSESSAPTYAFVAAESEDTPLFTLRGLAGTLSATVDRVPMSTVLSNYVRRDARDLHVYALRLSDAEMNDLILSLESASAAGLSRPYAFFSDNCATLAWDFLASILPELPRAPRPLGHPHELAAALIRAGRATLDGAIVARPTAARDAEHRRAGVAAQLRHRDAFPLDPRDADADTDAPRVGAAWAAFDRAADGSEPARARAALALAHALRPLPRLPAATMDALTEWLGLTFDIELHALDVRTGSAPPAMAATPLLRDLMLARAALPIRPAPLAQRRPRPAVAASGSRLYALSAGQAAGGAGLLAFSAALIAEAPGPVRAPTLRTKGRTTVLANEAVFDVRPGQAPALRENRTLVVDVASFGDAPRTDTTWLDARLGLAARLGFLTRPRDGLDLGAFAAAGPTLTLLSNADFSAYLVAGLELELGLWGVAGGPRPGVSPGVSLEAGLADAASGTSVRLRTRAAPTFTLPFEVSPTVEGEITVEAVLDRDSAVIGRIGLLWRHTPFGHEGWRVLAGVLF